MAKAWQQDHCFSVVTAYKERRIRENNPQFRGMVVTHTEYLVQYKARPHIYCTPCPPIQCVFLSDWSTRKHTLNWRTGSAVDVWMGFLLNQVLSVLRDHPSKLMVIFTHSPSTLKSVTQLPHDHCFSVVTTYKERGMRKNDHQFRRMVTTHTEYLV